MSIPNWNEFKKLRLERLKKEINRVDKDILTLLNVINNINDYVTLSSCSGRIIVIDLEKFGEKRNSVFLGKWHEQVTVDQVKLAIEKGKRQTWFILDPPILHIACKNLKAAENLMKIANDSGFKRAGLISLKNLVVEIASFEKIETPVAINGVRIVNDTFLEKVVEIANEKLKRCKEKLKKLELNLKKFGLRR